MPTKDQAHSHQFDRPITIQKPVYTDDGAGGQTVTWTTVYSPMADIQDMPHARGLTRRFFAQQNYPITNTIVAIRWQSQYHIDGSMRIVHVMDGLTQILKILDGGVFNASKKTIYMSCQQDQAKGVN